MTEFDADVVVIGAGPVGLTLANELARRDVRVRILDAAPSIREISKAMIWHVRTQEALAKIGIMDAGLREAQPLREVSMHAYGERIGSWHLDAVPGQFTHPLTIGQNRTQHLLCDLLRRRGLEVEWSTEVTRVVIRDEDVVISARAAQQEATIRARYVVGCEGSNSVVRKTLGLTFEGKRYSGEQFIQADCKIAWNMPSGRSYLFLTDDGYMMLIELPNGVVRIFISLPDRESHDEDVAQMGAVEDVHAEPSLDEVHEHFERLSGTRSSLSDPTWLARYRTSHRVANTLAHGRAFVAGDAGHVHVPIGGQGMNTGIQDAFNLGWKLAGVINDCYLPSILETYSAERLPVAQSLIRGTDRSYRGILHPSDMQQRLVRMFGPFAIKQTTVQRTFINVLEELTVSYPHSALNASDSRRGGPLPGHRVALTAPVVLAKDQRTVTLGELAREAEWLALCFAGATRIDEKLARESAGKIRRVAPQIIQTYVVSSDPNAVEEPDVPVIVDGERHAHHDFAANDGAIALLRPDDIVAGTWRLDQAEAAEGFLRGILV